jgi:hypothetical protein
MSISQPNLTTLREWYHLLQDTQALLEAPTKHHRELLHQAYAMRDAHVVDRGTLAEMLELADEALVYAHESSAQDHW